MPEQAEAIEAAEQVEISSAHQQARGQALAAAEALSSSAEAGTAAEESHQYELHTGDGRFLRIGRNFDEATVRRLFHHVLSTSPQQAELAGQAETAPGGVLPQGAEAVSAEAVSAEAVSAEAE
jgi:hypothetical protein